MEEGSVLGAVRCGVFWLGRQLKWLGGNVLSFLVAMCENPYIKEFENSFDTKGD